MVLHLPARATPTLESCVILKCPVAYLTTSCNLDAHGDALALPGVHLVAQEPVEEVDVHHRAQRRAARRCGAGAAAGGGRRRVRAQDRSWRTSRDDGGVVARSVLATRQRARSHSNTRGTPAKCRSAAAMPSSHSAVRSPRNALTRSRTRAYSVGVTSITARPLDPCGSAGRPR